MNASGLTIRRAAASDAALLWTWVNDAGVRRSAFHQQEVSPEEHAAWLERKLRDANCRIFLGEVDGQPIGQIRFDRNPADRRAEVDVSVAPASRGAGHGTALIRAGCEAYLTEFPTDVIEALIKSWNDASRRAFAKAGFIRGPADYKHPDTVRLVLL